MSKSEIKRVSALKEAARTPGPWRVDGAGIDAIVRGGDGVIVAARHRLRGIEHEANVRLIAAAPELLQELTHLVRLLEPYEHQLNIPGLATLNGARLAIAKSKEPA